MYQRCDAQTRQGQPGDLCRMAAGHGTDHVGIGRCKRHGGATASHVRAAAEIQADRDARLWLGQHVVIKPIDNPLTAYSQFAGEVAGWLEASRGVMADLTSESMRYFGKTGEQLRAEVGVFERAMDRMNTVLATYARLRIDERLAAITAEQKKMIIRALEAGLASAGVAGPAAVEAKKVAARHLRAVGENERAS